MSKGILSLAAAAATGALAVTAFVAAPALAATTVPSWNCRASLASVHLQGLDRIEPVVANGDIAEKTPDRPACADDATALPALKLGPITAVLPYASTSIDPTGAATKDQKAAGSTNAADVSVDLGGQLLIRAAAVRSDAAASCVNGQPKLDGASTLVNISINGQTLPLDGTLTQIGQAINGSPLNVLARVYVNQQDRTGDAGSPTQSLTQQAARVELLNAGQGPLATVVLGETKVSRSGATCSSTEPPSTTPPTTTVGVDSHSGPKSGQSNSSSSGKLVNGVNGGCGRLSMYFDRNRTHAFASRFGQRVVVRGRIVSCKGKPIQAAKIDVYHVIGGHRELVKTGLRSRPDGRLTLILPMNIGSRGLLFAYRGNLKSNKITSRVRMKITVRNRTGRVVH
jgi:hypothetical protein